MAKLTRVPVSGGELTVASWGDGGVPVLAIHGITASHLAWAEVARLHHGRIIAPDLRGRGGSAGLPGPFGMAAHTEDCGAVLDALGIERATVVGHSMGGFVAAALAHRHPSRVRNLVLVDGGAPLPGGDVDIEARLGPAIHRLSMRFASVEEYRDFWRGHPAFTEWSPAIESYVDYDLTGTPPRARPARRARPALPAPRGVRRPRARSDDRRDQPLHDPVRRGRRPRRGRRTRPLTPETNRCARSSLSRRVATVGGWPPGRTSAG